MKYKQEDRREDIFPGNVEMKKGPFGLPHPLQIGTMHQVYTFFFIHQISGMQLKQIEKWLYLVLGKLEKHVIGEKRSRWELYFR